MLFAGGQLKDGYPFCDIKLKTTACTRMMPGNIIVNNSNVFSKNK
jgi:hypothetical protein